MNNQVHSCSWDRSLPFSQASVCRHVPPSHGHPYSWSAILTGLYIWPQGEKSKSMSLEQSNSSPSPSEGKFTSGGDTHWLFHTLSDTTRLPSHVIKMTYSKSTCSCKSQKNAICNMTIWTRGFHPVSWKAILNFQKWVGILCLMKQPGQVLKSTLTETI